MSVPRPLAASLGLVLGLLALAAPLAAQEGVITGTVRDEAARPVANVTVRVQGEEIGALTDEQGAFRIPIDPGSYTLRFTMIGFRETTRTVTVRSGETTRVEVSLSPSAVELSEVVVSVSAREARRVELGTDIVRFDAAEAEEKSGATSFSDLLNARTTGVRVQQSSGTVGSASRVRVRGTNSITQDNNPIVYIDGARSSNDTGSGPGSFDFANGQTVSRLDDIDPRDIASVQVLKGPTAAALYGSEAASGVLIIETKRGSDREGVDIRYSHKQSLEYNHEDFWDNAFDVTPFGITGPDDPMLAQFRTVRNPVTNQVFVLNNPLKNPHTQPFRDARGVENFLSVRGTESLFGYYGSLNHETAEGTLPVNSLERTSIRGNFQIDPDESLSISISNGFIDSDLRLPDNDRSAVGFITNGGAGLPLFSFGTAPDGSRGDCLATILTGADPSVCQARQGNLTANFDKLATITNTQEVQRYIGAATTSWTPVPWLTGRLNLGLDFSDVSNVNLVPLDPDRPFGANSDGLRNEDQSDTRIFTFDAATTASFELGDFGLSTTGGLQSFRQHTEAVGCEGRDFAAPAATACDAALTFDGFSDEVEELEVGGFVQQQLSYRDWLFGTGSVRFDDNSSFGEEEDIITSPSANLSAVISSMPFWNVRPVNSLRLRFAWGQAAQAPDPFAALQTFAPIRVEQGGVQQIGVAPLDPGNPELAPEEQEEFEFGLDAGLLNDRIGLSFTYFDSETSDAILPTNVAPSTGFTGTQFVNIGTLENEGFELSLDAAILDREDVRWDLRFQLSTTDPVITDMGEIEPILFGLGANSQMFREGFSPGAVWGREIATAQRDANGNILPGSVTLKPGNVGDPDRPFDRFLGDAFPGNNESLSTTVTLFGRLTFFTLFDRSGDFVKLDDSQNFRSPFIEGVTTSTIFALRQAESTPEEQAAMEFGDFTRNALFTQDATFIKWREVTVRYDLPESLLRPLRIVRGASITVGGRELATITDYDGLDPELSFDGGTDSFEALEFFTQPPGRTFFAELDLNL